MEKIIDWENVPLSYFLAPITETTFVKKMIVESRVIRFKETIAKHNRGEITMNHLEEAFKLLPALKAIATSNANPSELIKDLSSIVGALESLYADWQKSLVPKSS